MIIIWRGQAERDLHYIFDFILQHDPQAAARLCDRIERRVAQLRSHPYMGRPGRVGGTRELIVAGTLTSSPIAWQVPRSTFSP
jgi:toxin ParE1/3/4